MATDYPRHKLLNKKRRQRSKRRICLSTCELPRRQLKSARTKYSSKCHVPSHVGKIARIRVRCSIRHASGFLISRRLVPQQEERRGERDSRWETRRRAVASIQSAVCANVRMRIHFALICVCMRMMTCGRARVAVVIERGIRWTDIFPFQLESSGRRISFPRSIILPSDLRYA
jgi:hypothetical protein